MSELIIQDNGVIARAEIDVMISTAKAYPRDVKRSIEYAEQLATMDEETAASCFYCLPRKDKEGNRKEIRGPSVRLAEIIASSWGNLHASTRIVENDGRNITTEGVAWDLQANVKISMQNKVSIIFGEKNGKGGYQANADMQTLLTNASSAKALRNAIFKVVPKALVNRVLEKAMNFSIGDQKTMNSKVQEVFSKLNKMGITTDKILTYYGKKTISEINSEEFKSLIGVGTAIKEGHIKIDDLFNVEQDTNQNHLSASEKISNLLHAKRMINEEEKQN